MSNERIELQGQWCNLKRPHAQEVSFPAPTILQLILFVSVLSCTTSQEGREMLAVGWRKIGSIYSLLCTDETLMGVDCNTISCPTNGDSVSGGLQKSSCFLFRSPMK